MSSPVSIANQALAILGAAPIVSFDDQTVEAEAMQIMYAPAKSQLLRSFPWRCATKTATLATLAEPSTNPFWEVASAWPDDAIRIVQIIPLGGTNANNNVTIPWESQGRQILTHIGNIAAQYIYDVPEPQMDAHVEMALVAQLAMDVSYTLTGNNTRESNLVSLYDRKLQEARTTDRQEGSHVNFQIDTLVLGR